MKRRPTIKQIDKFIDNANEECGNKICNYLTPLVQNEFDRLRKTRPWLTKIIFGNGTYLITTTEEKKYFLRQALYKEIIPLWLVGLCELCDRLSDIGGPEEDIKPKDL